MTSGIGKTDRADVKPDVATEAELIDVLDRFCSGFAERDKEAVIRLCAPDPDLVVVTSEEPLLRGPVELRRFLDRYVAGPTTYSVRPVGGGGYRFVAQGSRSGWHAIAIASEWPRGGGRHLPQGGRVPARYSEGPMS
jgi:hypothetical protein